MRMGRSLITLGFLIILAVILLGFLSTINPQNELLANFYTTKIQSLLLTCAGAALLMGLLFRMLAPVGKRLSQNRCRICGKPISPREIYCKQHLKEKVHQARDEELF